MSFTSSVHSLNNDPNRGDLDSKIECVDSLVAMLGNTTDLDKMSKKCLGKYFECSFSFLRYPDS